MGGAYDNYTLKYFGVGEAKSTKIKIKKQNPVQQWRKFERLQVETSKDFYVGLLLSCIIEALKCSI